MMGERAGPFDAHGLHDLGAGLGSHVVEDAVAPVFVAMGDQLLPVADVLEQRAAEGDVEDLHTPADAQCRHAPVDGRPHQRDLEPVADGADVGHLGPGLLAVEDRVDVAPAGEEQAVEAAQPLPGLGPVERDGRHDDGVGAGPLHRLEIGRRRCHRALSPAEHAPGQDGNPGDGDERSHHPKLAAQPAPNRRSVGARSAGPGQAEVAGGGGFVDPADGGGARRGGGRRSPVALGLGGHGQQGLRQGLDGLR